MKVNFDVDDTLIKGSKGKVKPQTVKLLKEFQNKGYQATIWSRRGKQHAQEVGKRIGLTNVHYASKNTKHNKPDIAVDNKERLGKRNIII